MPAFVLLVRRRDDGDPAMRVGYTVTKKIGNAVVRNRIKRRFRALAHDILPVDGVSGADHVLIGRADGLTRDFALLKADGGNWSFVDLSGAELRGARFTGVRLREADLTRARCAEAVFSGCDLSAASLTGADFSAADLTGSDLTGVDPEDVLLRGATIDVRQAVTLAEAAGMLVVPTPS